MEIVELEMCDVRSTTGSDLSSDAGCSSSGMTRCDSIVFDDGTEVPREVAELGLHGEINLFELSMEGQLQALAQAHARASAEKRLQQDWFLTPVLGKSLSWVRHHPPHPCSTPTAPLIALVALSYQHIPSGASNNLACAVAGGPHVERRQEYVPEDRGRGRRGCAWARKHLQRPADTCPEHMPQDPLQAGRLRRTEDRPPLAARLSRVYTPP